MAELGVMAVTRMSLPSGRLVGYCCATRLSTSFSV